MESPIAWLNLISPLSGTANLGLVMLAALTSWLSAAMGIGGGTLLIISMAQLMPAAALIPVHGMVQLGSNLGRAGMTWRYIDWPRIAAFIPGALLGAVFATWLLIRLPAAVLELTIAVFVLLMCWGPPLPARSVGRGGTAIVGLATTFISSFVGASGPLVAAFIKQAHAERMRHVATFSTAMTLQHLTKAFVFGAAGFAFHDWLGLVVLMVVAGVMGTWLGLHFLARLSDQRFDWLFKTILTLLALRLVWMALMEG
ncbi:sulfite exporter TauE/SafE family protein [Halomonas sp. WWR20]